MFEARIPSGGRPVKLAEDFRLDRDFRIASTTKLASAELAEVVVVRMRPVMARFSSSCQALLVHVALEARSIACIPRARKSPAMSRIGTS